MVRPSWASSTSPRPHAHCSCAPYPCAIAAVVSVAAGVAMPKQMLLDIALSVPMLLSHHLCCGCRSAFCLVLSPSYRLIASIHCQVLNEGVVTVQDGKTLMGELDVTKAACTLLMCALPLCCCCCCQCCCWRCYAKADVACHSAVRFEVGVVVGVAMLLVVGHMLLVVELCVPVLLSNLLARLVSMLTLCCCSRRLMLRRQEIAGDKRLPSTDLRHKVS